MRCQVHWLTELIREAWKFRQHVTPLTHKKTCHVCWFSWVVIFWCGISRSESFQQNQVLFLRMHGTLLKKPRKRLQYTSVRGGSSSLNLLKMIRLSTLEMNVVICPWHRLPCPGWQSSVALERRFEVKPQHTTFNPVLMTFPWNRAWHQTVRRSTGPIPNKCVQTMPHLERKAWLRGEEQECSGKGVEKGKAALELFSSRTLAKVSGDVPGL